MFVDDPRLLELLGEHAALVTAAWDRMPEGVGVLWPVREDGRVVDFETGYANAAAQRMFGIPLAERLGTRLFEALPFLRRDGHLERLAEVVETGEPATAEMLMEGAWAAVHPLQGLWLHRAVPFGPALLTYYSDITAARRRESELAQYAHVAAHDLREPLAAMTALVSLLQRRRDGLGDDITPIIDLLDEALAGARDMVDGILDYAGAGDAEKADVDVAELADEVLNRLAPRIAATGAEVVVGELPVVPADRAQLGRVLQNLVGNALKFRSAAPPRVEIDAARHDSEWTFTVVDNGVGVPADGAIFEMFVRRLDADEGRGAGIGLAVCRRVVEAHGGSIWAERREEGGSVLRFTLPAADRSGGGPAA